MTPARASGPEIPWVPYTLEVLAQAKAEGRPVLLYFSAAWCLPCQELSGTTFRAPAVLAAVEQLKMLPVKVDLTTSEPEEDEVRRKFRVVGVPTVVLLSPEGLELHRFTGLFDATSFLNVLQEKFIVRTSRVSKVYAGLVYITMIRRGFGESHFCSLSKT